MPHARVIQKPIASQNPYQALGEARKLFLLNLNFGSEDITDSKKRLRLLSVRADPC